VVALFPLDIATLSAATDLESRWLAREPAMTADQRTATTIVISVNHNAMRRAMKRRELWVDRQVGRGDKGAGEFMVSLYFVNE
jgi:hypothetical protein